MKTLSEMREIAERDETMRQFLIIHPTGGPLNGRFTDPHLGIMVFDKLPDKFVLVSQMEPYKTTGVFLNEPDT